MKKQLASEKFSDRLEKLLSAKETPTIAMLSETFTAQSFAIIILLLMLFPALPLPTGGISHVFEVISMLLALEMVIGRKTIWLPERWKHMKLGVFTKAKVLELILKRIRWFEKHSSPRWRGLLQLSFFTQITGGILFAFCLGALLAPPFSGLDTLPSLGAVLICLALILEDVILLIGGFVSGVAGIVLIIGFGSVIVNFAHRLFH